MLTAMGLPRDRTLGAVRLSLGKLTTTEEAEQAAESLANSWRKLSTDQQGEAAPA